MLAAIVEEQGFGAAFTLVVTGARADRVDVAPVVFPLRVHFRVAINLAGGGLQDGHAQALGEAEHVDGAVHRNLGGGHRVVLVMHRGGGAGEVEDGIHLDKQRHGDIVAHRLEARVVQQVADIAAPAGEVIIHREHFGAAGEQGFAQMRAEKAGAAGDQASFVLKHSGAPMHCWQRSNKTYSIGGYK